MTRGPNAFRKYEHLRTPAEFRSVYERRCSVSDDLLIVYGLRNDLSYSRVGFSVSRKAGPAVTRNRIRRLYREAYRLTRSEMPVGIDFVLIPRNSAPTLLDLQSSLRKLTTMLDKKLGASAGDVSIERSKPN